MLLAPVLVGAIDSGVRWVHVLLLAAWVVGFLAYNAAGLWLKARRRPRWWPPVRAYGAAAVVLTAALLALEPTLARWGVALVPAAAVSLAASAMRAERTFTNDLVAVAATGVVGVVAHGLGADGVDAWLPGAGSGRAWFLAGVLTAYFAGTVPYVKAMIRERGNPVVLRASDAVHAVLAAAAVAGAVWVAAGAPGRPGGVAPGTLPVAVVLAVLAVGLLARAALVPRLRPGTTPKALGIGEVVATVLLAGTLLALP